MKEKHSTLIIALLAVAIISGGVFLLFKKGSEGQPLEITLPTPLPIIPSEVKVYVSGAVAHPGVYSLKDGDRVEDALQAAGGATIEADLVRINLAARVRDQQQIHVPKLGETSSLTSPAQQRININTASAELLETLDGIGPVIAKRIIDYRNEHGPFKSIEELKEHKLLITSTYDKLKNLITVD